MLGPIELKSTITLTSISTNSVTTHSTVYTGRYPNCLCQLYSLNSMYVHVVHKPNETIGPLTTVTMITITGKLMKLTLSYISRLLYILILPPCSRSSYLCNIITWNGYNGFLFCGH